LFRLDGFYLRKCLADHHVVCSIAYRANRYSDNHGVPFCSYIRIPQLPVDHVEPYSREHETGKAHVSAWLGVDVILRSSRYIIPHSSLYALSVSAAYRLRAVSGVVVSQDESEMLLRSPALKLSSLANKNARSYLYDRAFVIRFQSLLPPLLQSANKM